MGATTPVGDLQRAGHADVQDHDGPGAQRTRRKEGDLSAHPAVHQEGAVDLDRREHAGDRRAREHVAPQVALVEHDAVPGVEGRGHHRGRDGERSMSRGEAAVDQRLQGAG